MPRIQANGIEFEYDEIGPDEGTPIVLVMGYTAQMTRWPDSFRKGLADAGYRVIRFDNRDAGLSHQFDDEGMPDMGALIGALTSGDDATAHAPYLVDDMASDTAAIIDALGAKPAHVLGASMGGMIIQLLALDHPDFVRSIIPVMTTSGDPSLPAATPEAMAVLTELPPSQEKADIVAQGLKTQRVIGSDSSLTLDDQALAERIGSDVDRAFRPGGTARQYAAILAQPRWHQRLSSVDTPTLVLHGKIDPLIPIEGGRDVAAQIPKAEMIEFEKWGHDLPPAIVPQLLDSVLKFIRKVDGQA